MHAYMPNMNSYQPVIIGDQKKKPTKIYTCEVHSINGTSGLILQLCFLYNQHTLEDDKFT